MAEGIASDAVEPVASREFIRDWALPHEMGERLAEVLSEQAESIAIEWHAELRSRLGLRPERIFPGGELLSEVPGLVQHLAGSLAEGDEWSRDVLDDVADLVAVRRSQGYHVEELLLEIDLLADILFGRLNAALRADPYVSPGAAATAVARLSDAIRKLGTRVVGLHREQRAEARERQEDVLRTLQHELRNPLSVLVQSAELLARSELREEVRRSIADRLGRAAERSRDLIDTLPDVLAPAAARESRLERLPAVIDDVVGAARDALGGRDVELSVAGEVPEVQVDEPNTALVLHNLLTNAIRYADPEEEERWVRIEVRRGEGDGEWVVRVEDNGLGVPPEYREEIFERFARVRDHREGHGLGLAIARDAVRRMGGRISCESEEGVGSVFAFTVPEVGPSPDERS